MTYTVNGLDYVATNLVMRSALLNESGATINMHGHEAPGRGYYVGGLIESLVFAPGEITFPGVREFLSALDRVGLLYVGFWVDSETGKIYFDGVDWFTSEDNALKAARDRDEIAIWDVANEREIRV